jgi:hypothetical protein
VKKRMLGAALIFLFAVLHQSTNAFAKTTRFSIEGSAGFGTSPQDINSDSTVGFSIGQGLFVTDNFQARIDVSYFKWNDKSCSRCDLLRNIPIVLGGRFYFPVAPQIRLFGEVGVGAELLEYLGSQKYGISLVPGVGAELMVVPQLGLGVDLRRHYFLFNSIEDQFTFNRSNDFRAIDLNFSTVMFYLSYYIQ